MGKVLVGTCSWTEPTLIDSGRFYPDWARSPEGRLRFYASQFPIVEVDSSYYALTSERTSRLWVERTPEDFVFDVKAFRLLTQHPTPHSALPNDTRQALPQAASDKANVYQKDVPSDVLDELWGRFERSLLPLDSAGKLGVVLFQFPPWFHFGTEQRQYILSCQARLPQYRVAIEFRHGSWLNENNRESTLALLREGNLPFVSVDEPQAFKSSAPPVVEATSDIAVVRFHGRNRETWEKKGLTAAQRFNYLYSEDELRPWAGSIRELSSRTKAVHVLFNNCYGDKAVVNARQTRLMLD